MDKQEKAKLLRSLGEKFGITEVVCMENGDRLPLTDLIEWVYERKDIDAMKIEDRKLEFGLSLKPYYDEGTYPRKMLATFFNYWAEPDKKGKKLRFEYEKTWSLKLRLHTFAARNKHNFKMPPSELDVLLNKDVAKPNEPINHERLFHG